MINLPDTEIIKSLECWIKNFDGKAVDLMTLCGAIDLIKRKRKQVVELFEMNLRHEEELKTAKALIERLKQERDKEHNYCNHYMRMCAKAKSEACKEFAERVKALLPYDGMSPEGRFKFGRIKSLDIDNLLKEMG